MPSLTTFKLEQLKNAADELMVNYLAKRKAMDQERMLGLYLPFTHNPKRLNDIQFVQKISTYIHENRFRYKYIDPNFATSSYNNDVIPFLKQTIIGAFLFELLKITTIYTDETVKDYSALGAVILEFFQIDKLSDIPKHELTTSLLSLQQFMMSTQVASPTIHWHDTISNQPLIEKIDGLIKSIVPFPLPPTEKFSWWGLMS